MDQKKYEAFKNLLVLTRDGAQDLYRNHEVLPEAYQVFSKLPKDTADQALQAVAAVLLKEYGRQMNQIVKAAMSCQRCLTELGAYDDDEEELRQREEDIEDADDVKRDEAEE